MQYLTILGYILLFLFITALNGMSERSVKYGLYNHSKDQQNLVCRQCFTWRNVKPEENRWICQIDGLVQDCSNRLVSQMQVPLAASPEPAGKLWQLCKVLYVFEHKMQYLLIHAPFTHIVVFWHNSNVPQWFRSQICCITAMFCIAAIFVKYCYTTGSGLL